MDGAKSRPGPFIPKRSRAARRLLKKHAQIIAEEKNRHGTAPLIFFEDEGRFGRISNLAESWSPKGKWPLVPRQVVRESLHAFAAVAPIEGQLYWQVHERCNTASMSLFHLGLLEAYPDRWIVRFLDGAGWHRSKRLPVPERLRLEFLPAAPRKPIQRNTVGMK